MQTNQAASMSIQQQIPKQELSQLRKLGIQTLLIAIEKLATKIMKSIPILEREIVKVVQRHIEGYFL